MAKRLRLPMWFLVAGVGAHSALPTYLLVTKHRLDPTYSAERLGRPLLIIEFPVSLAYVDASGWKLRPTAQEF